MTRNERAQTIRAVLPLAKPCDEPKLSSRGRYQICMELASGEDSTIYLALYRAADGFERVVVVKRIHAALSSKPNFAATLLQEAQALSRVSHPMVCRLLDVGRLEDSYFVVMEYVEGESVQAIRRAYDRIKDSAAERMPLIAARVFAKLCEGLHAVHEARTELERKTGSQRVLTPRNLFVLYDGSVRLLDFAVAAPQGMLQRTNKGVIKEQVAYMAPEHFAEGEIDRRADIWSVGVALWEMLTGRRLFDAGLINDTLQSVNKKRVVAPSALNRHVPPALDEIVMRALEREVSLRQQSARELSDALENFLAAAGEAVAPGHVANWLDGLFPGKADEKRGLRCVAQTIGERLAPPSLCAQSKEGVPEISDVALRRVTPPIANGVAAATAPIVEPATEPRSDGWRKRALMMLAGAVVTGVIVFGALKWLEQGALVAPVAGSAPAGPEPSASNPAPAPGGDLEPAAAPGSALRANTGLAQPNVETTVQPIARPDAAPQAIAPAPADPQLPAAPANAVAAPAASADALAPPPRAAGRHPGTKSSALANRARPLPPPPAAGAAALAEGYVYLIASPGSANIVWQGRTLGRTPMRVRLPAGTHRLELRPISGGASVPLEVTIKAGEGALASINLAP